MRGQLNDNSFTGRYYYKERENCQEKTRSPSYRRHKRLCAKWGLVDEQYEKVGLIWAANNENR